MHSIKTRLLMVQKLTNSTNKGKAAESIACDYLQQKGLKLITRNYHCRQGEIDIIMDDNGTTVFIEVRYRKNASFGDAKESITLQKQNKIRTTALHYLHSFPEKNNARFDVIAITGENSQQQFEWVRNAF
ncbi:MAG: YraN family protein [Gammaproteobacteria bacterium]|nr:YraN family protein [Gammaproteobacteria bacterium]